MLRTNTAPLALTLVLLAIPGAAPAAKPPAGAPAQGQSPAPPAPTTPAPAAPAEPATTMPVKPTDADVQVALERSSFSPGEIDGRGGANTRKALQAFQRSRSLPVTARLSAETWKSLWTASAGPTLASYTITVDDAAGPYLAKIPKDTEEQAKLERLGYTSVLEMLGERFHAAPEYLRRLNPRARFAAGEEIKTPNTRLPVLAEAASGEVRVVVSRKAGTLTVERGGKVLFFAPVTSGSAHDPLPIGDWKVKGVARDPVFRYNPDLFWDSDASAVKATIPAGPNNPVGVVWIDLDKPHYGLHGTPEPRTIGRTASHGCVRLTNWDAMTVAGLVKPGTPVLLRP
jgi:lipoprotein-anchoring transpeptidase ErfK/SrfK